MMTSEQFKKWKANGNLKLDYKRYLELSNDLSENIAIKPKELLELAKFLSLCDCELNSEIQRLKLTVLSFALQFQKP